ncbi:hypothetical protein [Amycolatopsis sp. PS_44_ISF1]|uniref:hypothetical protein n=1 Tax=Amycolatopsis sp. PS_44_ISF1 TaxID=2974917 RepID=UPI0028DDF1B6|nr:hypothetical protein [Amycolatopsis sp. PS_44_ISF1]MDT8913464.1 hypothetical protein [Amycolatopsis sp. PS_44_ISF1]
MRATVRGIGRDPDLVARHIELEGWPDEVRGHLEIAGLLSVLYRETGRLLALATDISEAPGCGYIAMPGTIELPGEDARAAARWELRWAEARLSDVAFDADKDQWRTGFAAAEQAVVAANQILKLVSSDSEPAHADPRAPGWDDAARTLKLAQQMLDEARAGRTHTTTPFDEA